MTVTVIIPTCGRPCLAAALASVTPQLEPGDQVLVIRDASGDWGHTARNAAMPRAAGDVLLFLDDDDVYFPGALEAVRRAAAEHPGRVLIFRMKRGEPHNDELPGAPAVECGNVSTQMFAVPNDPARLGRWGSRYEGDFDFLTSTLEHYPDGPVWRDELVAHWRPGDNP
jgi:glycosyltransferase involved in cell wall biosynthesis